MPLLHNAVVATQATIQLVAVCDSVICRLRSTDHSKMWGRVFASKDFDSQGAKPIHQEFQVIISLSGAWSFRVGQGSSELTDDCLVLNLYGPVANNRRRFARF